MESANKLKPLIKYSIEYDDFEDFDLNIELDSIPEKNDKTIKVYIPNKSKSNTKELF